VGANDESDGLVHSTSILALVGDRPPIPSRSYADFLSHTGPGYTRGVPVGGRSLSTKSSTDHPAAALCQPTA
jgi:hypothetical protein